MDKIQPDCAALYLLGDLFDFWFEYKLAIPKGFVRLQARIAEFTDAGIPVHLFHGNHDLWQRDYFEKELGVKVHAGPLEIQLNGQQIYMAHGDGLGPGQFRFKAILAMYRNPLFQWLFRWVHPDAGIGIANWFSHRSKLKTFDGNFTFYEEKEHLVQYARTCIANGNKASWFIFGHRHLPMIYRLNEHQHYVNLGDWIGFNTYAVFDGTELKLEKFEGA